MKYYQEEISEKIKNFCKEVPVMQIPPEQNKCQSS